MKFRDFFLMMFMIAQVINLRAQNFYDLNTIQTIEITFAESNWDQLMDAQKAGDEDYIMAKSVIINGEAFDSVGVKYKGNSTYNANQIKNPLHIELDTYKKQNYNSYVDIKLSNVANDPSFVREVLSYQILGQYMDAPLSNYANVYINGTLMGLYSNSEAINKDFIKDRFYSKNNTFIKCNPPAGAGPWSNDYPNLVYLGGDSTAYYDSYELKSDYGWQELINLCDTLTNHIADIEKILDVDRALWMLAFNNVLVNLDSYSGQFAQNYYLYRDDYGRFNTVMWDFNESFGRFSQTGTSNLNNTVAKQQMTHLLHNSDAAFPLIQKLLSTPMYKRIYLAHMKTILLENFDNGAYYEQGLALQEMIDTDVQADPNKFFTYTNFIANLTSDVSGGGFGPQAAATPGITNLMDGRSSYLLGLSDFNQTEPAISQIELSDETPNIGSSITISASIVDASTAYLAFRTDVEAPFTKILMYDDGSHNDGAAGDDIYGASFDIENTYVQYYIYAENSNAGMLSPQRAEHEFYSFTATVSDVLPGNLVINEFMASNASAIADQDDEYDDWIELFNNSSTTVSLQGYYLSDDAEDLTKWAFPSGTKIGAGSYLTIWADKDETQTGLHANFKLSASSESIFLVDPSGTIIDEVSYIDQITDISYGRYVNGTGNFQYMYPSFSDLNIDGVTKAESVYEQKLEIRAYPNPVGDILSVDVNSHYQQNLNLEVFTIDGQLAFSSPISQSISINTSEWISGMYLLRIEDSVLKVIVQH